MRGQLDEHLQEVTRKLRVAAAQCYGLEESGLYQGQTRAVRLMRARQAVIYVLRCDLSVGVKQVAKLLRLDEQTVESNYVRMHSRTEGGTLDPLTAKSLLALRTIAGVQ